MRITSTTTGAVLIVVIIVGVLLGAYFITHYWILGARLPGFVRNITNWGNDEERG